MPEEKKEVMPLKSHRLSWGTLETNFCNGCRVYYCFPLSHWALQWIHKLRVKHADKTTGCSREEVVERYERKCYLCSAWFIMQTRKAGRKYNWNWDRKEEGRRKEEVKGVGDLLHACAVHVVCGLAWVLVCVLMDVHVREIWCCSCWFCFKTMWMSINVWHTHIWLKEDFLSDKARTSSISVSAE